MDSADRDDLCAVLERARSDLRARMRSGDAELDRLRTARGADTADDEHDPEGATLSGEWAMRESVRLTVLREEAELDAALVRWQEGTYGVCADCGGDIPLARLRVRPTAERCVPCAGRVR